jgi:hypothetical protein
MPRQPAPKRDNPEQSKRFIDMAREVGVDERTEAFDLAFDKVIRPSQKIKRPQGRQNPHR